MATPQAIIDALDKAQASKAAADSAANDAVAKAQAATQAATDAQQAALKAKTAAGQLESDRQALDTVIDGYFQVGTVATPATSVPPAVSPTPAGA